MQPIGPVLPELDPFRHYAKTAPVTRPRNLSRILRRQRSSPCLKLLTANQRTALLRSYSSDLATPRPAMKILIRVGIRRRFDRSLHPNLPPLTLPVKAKRCIRIREQFFTLLTLDIRVESEAAFIHMLHQHHPHGRSSFHRRRCQCHRIRIVQLIFCRQIEPSLEQCNRILRLYSIKHVHLFSLQTRCDLHDPGNRCTQKRPRNLPWPFNDRSIRGNLSEAHDVIAAIDIHDLASDSRSQRRSQKQRRSSHFDLLYIPVQGCPL